MRFEYWVFCFQEGTVTQVEVVLEEIPEETFEESVVEVVVILEDNDGNKYYVDENDEIQPLPEVDSNPGDEVGSSHFLHNTLYHVLLQTSPLNEFLTFNRLYTRNISTTLLTKVCQRRLSSLMVMIPCEAL